MPPSRAEFPLRATPADTTKAVDDFMAALDHPCKGAAFAAVLRQWIAHV